MQASTGWGGSTGAKPKPKPKRSSGGGGGGGGGGWHPDPSTPGRLRDWNAQKAQGPERPGWGAPEPKQESKPWYTGMTAQDFMKGTSPQHAPQVEGLYKPQQDARKAKEAAERKAIHNARLQRIEAMRDPGGEGEGAPKVERMTWAEYNALTPQERAAIDFNTMLVRAVRKDKKLQDKYVVGPDERAKYDKGLEQMFGSKGRGSDDLYAPETMAVLKQINFKDRNADLDDFLSLKVAITDEDLKSIDLPGSANAPKGKMETQSFNSGNVNKIADVQTKLANKTRHMEQKLVNGNRLIASVQAMTRQERSMIIEELGGQVKEAKPGIGFGPEKWVDQPGGEPADLNTYFIQAFDQLAGNRANDISEGEVLGSVREVLSRRGLPMENFIDYVNDRTQVAGQYDLKLGLTKKAPYRTPRGLRRRVGLGRGPTNE